MINYDPKTMRCHECLYYLGIRKSDTSIQGYCRRFPPVATSDGRSYNNRPLVDSLDTCGEWRHA